MLCERSRPRFIRQGLRAENTIGYGRCAGECGQIGRLHVVQRYSWVVL